MSLIDWAVANGGERSVVAQGILGLRLFDYVAEDTDLEDNGGGPVAVPNPKARLPVSDLTVWSHQHPERPIWHRSTGLYGFTRLTNALHTIQVHDPLGRFLPRLVEVNPPDRSDTRLALEQGLEPPPSAAGPLYADVPMRPAIGYPVPPAETVLWGTVSHDPGTGPVLNPFARVAITYPVEPTVFRTVITHADVMGTWIALLRGARSPSETSSDISIDLAANRFLPALPTDPTIDPATVLSPDFDTLVPADVFYASTAHTETRNQTVGERTRLNLSVP